MIEAGSQAIQISIPDLVFMTAMPLHSTPGRLLLHAVMQDTCGQDTNVLTRSELAISSCNTSNKKLETAFRAAQSSHTSTYVDKPTTKATFCCTLRKLHTH